MGKEASTHRWAGATGAKDCCAHLHTNCRTHALHATRRDKDGGKTPRRRARRVAYSPRAGPFETGRLPPGASCSSIASAGGPHVPPWRVALAAGPGRNPVLVLSSLHRPAPRTLESALLTLGGWRRPSLPAGLAGGTLCISRSVNSIACGLAAVKPRRPASPTCRPASTSLFATPGPRRV